MELGMFIQPGHPPERGYKAGWDWDLRVIKELDQLGYSEVWLGEHFTSHWETDPAPDLLIAQALAQTEQIKLAAGAHALPYHHPLELAHRVAMLDHLSQGRIMMGAGSGAIPTDWRAFCVDGTTGEHRAMAQESLDIILKVWTDRQPWRYEGKFWTIERIPDNTVGDILGHHLYPYQDPHPPVAFAGFSPNSGSLKFAGERGFLPMSLSMNQRYMASHWDAVTAGAKQGGRVANRKDWRVVKEVFVADTDEEARKHVLDGAMGRLYREYFLPLYTEFGFLPHFTHDDSVPPEDVTVDYLFNHHWIVGSVDTVAEKLQSFYDACGGFGTMLVHAVDYADDPDPWLNSLQLLKNKVAPRLP